MNFLSSLVKAAPSPAQQEVSPHEIIEKLCDRLRTSTMIEDKRAAILSLKGLSRQYQLEVGTQATQLLLEILHDEYCMEDAEIVKSVLDTFINLCQGDYQESSVVSSFNTDTAGQSSQQNLGLQFSQILLKNCENVPFMINTLLQDYSFHVQFALIELLRILVRNDLTLFQKNIINGAGCISHIMNLLSDSREVLRNEGILLLVDLTSPSSHGSFADIQKIIAFDNAFEQCLHLAIEVEGGIYGQVVVEDCLCLIYNLLKDNSSNQNYFRESGLIPKLLTFFRYDLSVLPAGGKLPSRLTLGTPPKLTLNGDEEFSVQQCRNLNKMLDVMDLLVFSGSQSASSGIVNNQVVFINCGLWYPFLMFGLFGPPADQIQSGYDIVCLLRSRCLYTLAYSIQELPAGQSLINCIAIKSQQPTEMPTALLTYCMQMAFQSTHVDLPQSVGDDRLRSNCQLRLRFGAFELIKSSVVGNSDLIQVLVNFVKLGIQSGGSGGSIIGDNGFGDLLLDSLLDYQYARKRNDIYRVWFASCIFSLLISSSPENRNICLSAKISSPSDLIDGEKDLFTSIINCVMVCSRDSSSDYRLLITYLSMLSLCLADSSEWCGKFMKESSRFAFLLEQIQSHPSQVVQGLCAYLIGLLFEYNDGQVKTLGRAEISNVVITRVGVESYSSKMNRLRDAVVSYQPIYAANRIPSAVSNEDEPVLFIEEFIEQFKSHSDSIQKSVVNPKSVKLKQRQQEESKQHENAMQSYKVLISEQDQTIASLKAEVSQLKQQLSSKQQQIQQQSSPQSNNHKQLEQIDIEKHPVMIDLRQQLSEANEQYQSVNQEMEDLLVCLAEQDVEMKKLKQRLKELGDNVVDVENSFDGEQLGVTAQVHSLALNDEQEQQDKKGEEVHRAPIDMPSPGEQKQEIDNVFNNYQQYNDKPFAFDSNPEIKDGLTDIFDTIEEPSLL
ncbi:hypothetical protein MIR68_006160 [Amoeboaphelidium protococcarum]|nr:hypothetical protein MIR68_006160 [Amoeboaphelidium protococcarum]